MVKPLRLLFVGLVLALGSEVSLLIQPLAAQSSQPSLKVEPTSTKLRPSSKRSVRVVFNPPRGGAPARTRSGASRGDVCFEPRTSGSSQFLAIAPTAAEGLTVSSHPTFFVYLPSTSAKQAIFSLRDDQGHVVYQMPVSLETVDQQLLAISLPKAAPGLEVGTRYRWMVAVLCSGKLEPGSPIASSWVKRIALSELISQPSAARFSLEQAALYGAQGVWYDMIAAVVHQRRLNPNDAALESNWQEILINVGLTEIAKASLLVY